MKARVKGTTNIIEVEFNKDALNAGYPPYHDRENNMYYQPEQLVWVDNDNEGDADRPDYWTRLEHQAGIAAMQGLILTASKHMGTDQEVAQWACECAHALVEKMKNTNE